MALRRAALWLLAATALLVLGFAALVLAIAVLSLARSGEWRVTALQVLTARLLFVHVLVEALLPQLAATLASWWLLARAFPALEAGWRLLVTRLPLLAALWFPPIGAFCFRIWEPRSAGDYAATLLLTTGGVSLALLIPRRALRALRPGCFARDRAGVILAR